VEVVQQALNPKPADGPIIGAGPQHVTHDRLIPDLVVRSPGYLALLVGQLQRRADLVALVPQAGRLCRAWSPAGCRRGRR